MRCRKRISSFLRGCAIATEGWFDLPLSIAAFAVLVAFEGKLHPIFVILACGVVGLLFF